MDYNQLLAEIDSVSKAFEIFILNYICIFYMFFKKSKSFFHDHGLYIEKYAYDERKCYCFIKLNGDLQCMNIYYVHATSTCKFPMCCHAYCFSQLPYSNRKFYIQSVYKRNPSMSQMKVNQYCMNP